MKNTAIASDTYCNIVEQINLVSKMTECDESRENYEEKIECYLETTRESRENKACMYS